MLAYSPGPKAVSPGAASTKAGAGQADNKADTPSKEPTGGDREQAATPSTVAPDDAKKAPKSE